MAGGTGSGRPPHSFHPLRHRHSPLSWQLFEIATTFVPVTKGGSVMTVPTQANAGPIDRHTTDTSGLSS